MLEILEKIVSKAKVLSSITTFAGRIKENDLKTKHGIRVRVTWEEISTQKCYCPIGKDHGEFYPNPGFRNINFNFSIV